VTVGSGTELTPRIQLTSSAYSLKSQAIVDSAVTASSIADGTVVRHINDLSDNINLVAGDNIVITQEDNSLVFSAAGGEGGVDITAEQKAALAGTFGTPSENNRYLTDDDPRNSNPRSPTGNAGGVLTGTYPNPSFGVGRVVRSLNNLKDDVTLLAGNNVTITSGGNALTIAATTDSGDRNSLDAADGNPSDVIYVDDSGNIGIGTSTPAYRMDAVGNRLRFRNSTVSGAKALSLRTDGSAVDIDVDNADLFLKSNSGNTIIQAFGGNVGIVTGSPQQKLHVAGVSRFDVNGSFDISTPGGWPGIITIPSASGHRRDIIFDSGGIRLLTSPSSSPPAAANGICITENGSIGIGTQTPGSKLQISGGGIIIQRDGSDPFIRFSHNYLDLPPVYNAETWTLQANSPNQGSFYIRNESDNVDRFIIDGNGNVYVNGGLAHSSDQRLKYNVEKIDDALIKVMKLRGVRFRWKQRTPGDTPDKEMQIGLIAQEVERVYPELVKTGHGGYKFVTYANITAILIEALKEQQKIISEQNAMLNQQQAELHKIKNAVSEIDRMKAKITKLESALQNFDFLAVAHEKD
jgi:hypothetical protein